MEESVGEARQKLALALVEGATRLIELYGCWLSFHDAEVESIQIEREGPTVTILFTTNDRVDKEGETQGDQLARVTVRWYEVEELTLQATDWDEQNWIWDLKLTAHEAGIRAEVVPNEGIGGSIVARRMAVLDVQPSKPFRGEHRKLRPAARAGRDGVPHHKPAYDPNDTASGTSSSPQ